MPRVLVAGRIHPDGIDLLRDRPDLDVDLVDETDDAAFRPRLAEADAVIIRTQRLDAEAIAGAPGLKVVSRHGVGYDAIDVAALTRAGIPLTVVGDVNAVTVAEHAMFLMLALARRALINDRAVRRGGWAIRDEFACVELDRHTLLLIGFGRIGRLVCARARAFGMRVLAHDPYVEPAAIRDHGAEPVDRLPDGLAAADVVSIHLPFSEETRGLIGEAELAAMKPSAFLINTARGGHVDEAALYGALSANRIAGAGLDVYAEEPPPADHPLYALDNVVLSPHLAGLTSECAARMAVAAARNALDGLDGTLDPVLVVNPEVLPAAATVG